MNEETITATLPMAEYEKLKRMRDTVEGLIKYASELSVCLKKETPNLSSETLDAIQHFQCALGACTTNVSLKFLTENKDAYWGMSLPFKF